MKMKNTMPLLAGLAVLAAVIIFGFGSMEHPVRDDAGLDVYKRQTVCRVRRAS